MDSTANGDRCERLEERVAHRLGIVTARQMDELHEAPRDQVAEAVRSVVAFESIVCVDPALLLRAIEVYETERIDFAEAYLVACAESTGVVRIAPFDRSIDRVVTVERVEPPPD